MPAEAKSKPRGKQTGKRQAIELTDQMGIAAAQQAGVRLTSPDRVVFPGQGVTKARIVAYYAAVADRMLPFLAGRPLSLVRCPQGRAKSCFFQRHDSGGFPDEIKKVAITEKDGEVEDYFYIDDLAGLIAATQMNTLEYHIWGCRRDEIDKPERVIFDIDPDEGLGFEHVRSAAIDIRKALGEWGLESFPMVTGGKGIHVIAPLQRVTEWPEVKAFCKTFAQRLAEAEPDRFTARLGKAKRKGRLFIDYLRNERGSTAICPWSTRSREGAPCAVPVSWDEVETLERANAFSLGHAAARATEKDPWPDYFKLSQSITKGMVNAVAGPLR
ncbi:MAG: non-homologous end-joining DNA ligase [Devosia sp.]